jgi:hypothetical protein
MMSYFRRDRHWTATAFAFTLAALCLALVATAQQFRTDPVGDEKVKREGLKAKKWTGDSAYYNADKANFAAFFQQYYFPAMTRNTPSDLAELGKLRVDLFKKYLWATTNTQLQNDLTAMAFKAMGPIVISKEVPPYHPSVRYNAVLVIGMLDSEYGNETRPPKPHPKGTMQLTFIVNASLKGNQQFPPAVVLGALIGLERHAKYHQSLDPAAVKTMSTALLDFVNTDKPIQGMDPAAYAWLRLRAASALANLGSLGEQNVVHDSLIKLIANTKSLDDRCSAAGLLSAFKDEKENKYDKTKVDGPATTKALFKLTSDLSAEELKRAQDFEKNPNVVSSSPLSVASNDPDAQDDGYPRRHVLARIKSLGSGLNAVKPALPEESQKQVDAIITAFKPVVIAATDDRIGPLGVADAVRKMSGAISATIGDPEGEGEDADDITAGSPAPDAAAAIAPAPPAAAPGTAPAAAPGTEPAAPPAAEALPTEAPVATPPSAAPPEDATN